MKYVVGFGRFWYDFIVGDSVILAMGGLAVLAIGAVLTRAGNPLLAEIALPAIVVCTLAASLLNEH